LLDPKTDENMKSFFVRLTDAEYVPTWHALRTDPANALSFASRYPDPAMRANERQAAEKTQVHAGTPTVAHFETLGRTFLTVAHNKFKYSNTSPADPPIEEFYRTRVELDIEGNQRAVRDAVIQNGDTLGRIVMRYDYDVLGNRIHQASMEAGERWILNDVKGRPIRAWDSRGFTRRSTYDELRRPTGLFVTENVTEGLAEGTVYGESQGIAGNHRTRVYQIFDAGGVVTSEEYDFKGNLRQSKRELLPDYKTAVDWQQNPTPDYGMYSNITTYDALSRPLTVTTPDGSIYCPTFNEANLLDKVDVKLRRGAASATSFVRNINYNAKGQRELIEYGNGTSTAYQYDPLTFRLIRLRTTRAAGPNGLASQLFTDPTVSQNLHYTYDPAGNIIRIADTSLARLSPNVIDNVPSDYTYDAIYRLIEASGREHIGQTTHDFNPQNRRDYDFAGLADFMAHPNDLQAMRRYTERYGYDAVANFQFLRHIANAGSWARSCEYNEASLIEPFKQSNRLTRTTVGNGLNHVEVYTYRDADGNDVHGCMTALNSMQMGWDFKDQLQKADLGGGGTAYYVYDSSGQRIRKVIERQSGGISEERIYLGGFEIYRKFGANALERETLHVMDDKQRIALVETGASESGNPVNTPVPVQRYQLGNHLGSATLELDEDGALISYEEYHPYGTTALQAMDSSAEVSLKRYRYTGMERDEETGFAYHTARYYAPWLGKWLTADPLGVQSGTNLYAYSRGNPIGRFDKNGKEDEYCYTPFCGDPAPIAFVKDLATGFWKESEDIVADVDERLSHPEWAKRLVEDPGQAVADFAQWVNEAGPAKSFANSVEGLAESYGGYEEAIAEGKPQSAGGHLARTTAAAVDVALQVAPVVDFLGAVLPEVGLSLSAIKGEGTLFGRWAAGRAVEVEAAAATDELARTVSGEFEAKAVQDLRNNGPKNKVIVNITSEAALEPNAKSIWKPGARRSPIEPPYWDAPKQRIHGRLPNPADFSRYSEDELLSLREGTTLSPDNGFAVNPGLEGSVETRIRANIDKGNTGGHGARQMGEQRLIRQIEKYLKGFKEAEKPKL
jgi:RHS repeat-associated protein